ncbi:MAG: hypothetical protein Q4D38_00095 [Planctomycetia bacterium]|nr:hypothetical protein [Planctomycetia bacterium]
MTTLRLHFKKAVSPWKDTTRAVRIAYKCTGVDTIEGSTTTEAVIPSAIFVYSQKGDSYQFDHIASATDLVDIPETDGGAFVRKDYLDILVPCMSIANKCCNDIEDDIQFLIDNIAEYTTLVGTSEHSVEAVLK